MASNGQIGETEMRKLFFAAMATLAVALGSVAVVGAAKADTSSRAAPLNLDDWGRDAPGGA
jgi:hypothetical protein